ncbi:MAG: nucleotidyl transferase AbiEii/AbiGii toxin family protein [Flammeovirgaceae bacterium]|nr:MAG: nucleotidyl transferase AbiEii/AbiGii toxin family protein [Flammeovirgaceae bacterium]
MSLSDLYKEITTQLEARGIPYMVSGSIALLAYSTARVTRDIDVVIELDAASLDLFCEIFKDNFFIHRPSIEEEVQRRGMFNVIDNRSGFKIDFVLKKNSPYRKTEFERRVRKKLFGHEAWIVSAEDLILSKLIWIQDIQSDRHLEDLRNLLENPVDHKYLRYWLMELQLNTFGVL